MCLCGSGTNSKVGLTSIQVHAVTSVTDISQKQYTINGKLFVKAVKVVQIYA